MSSSPETRTADFQRQQLAFTAHIRDPDRAPLPEGIPPRHMRVYSELLFNNLDDQLAANFPVLRRITADDTWAGMVRDFMRRHRCTTPLFTEIGTEFIDYLRDEREPASGDWPFMLELAHYEYAELAVAIGDDESTAAYDPNGDLLRGRPLVAPSAWNLRYRWPVHLIGPDYLPCEPPAEPTDLVVHRDRHDQVHFLQINAVSQRLLQLLKEKPALTGLDVLKTIAAELAHPDPETVVTGGTGLLADLRRRHVILGTRE